MNWLAKLNDDPLPWLLEPDPANPGVRYFTLRDLLDRPTDDLELRQAQADVMLTGPARAILDAQVPDGYWNKPGAGYGPKYTGTVWSVIFLAMFGADGRDPAVRRGCDYVLDHSRARAPYGGFERAGGVVPDRDGAMPGRQPVRGADRPGVAGRPSAHRGVGLAGAQHHRRGDRACG